MRKRGIFGPTFLLLLMSLASLVGTLPGISGEPTTIIVPDHYSTIQEALDNANEGDTIFVRNGTYVETIVINRTVSLEGESQEGTVIRIPESERDIITITADNVTVQGFTIRGTGLNWQGIWIRSSHCLVDGNIIEHVREGVFLDGRAHSITDNVVTNNCIRNSDDCGVLVWSSTDNQIESNNITDNKWGVYFFSLGPKATRNLVENNQIINSINAGVVLDLHSSSNIIKRNRVSSNGWLGDTYMSGIVLNVQSVANQILYNKIDNNKRGIYQYYASSSNSIHHNSLTSNGVQVYHEDHPEYPSVNVWDTGYPTGGNYWSDYVGTDLFRGLYQNETGSDGIGDTPYIIDADNIDHYPLMNPYSPLPADVNEDLIVDIQDIALVALCFGSCPTHPRWDPVADVNRDNQINVIDTALVASKFGTKWTPL
ncbi:MAG: right-handed parallel beta-helix repeat-containing protein [Candidatus Bathyarchaeota archaeon]|nr:MAG: right-handed parallel beta-helix repeat-containing protein [Candidatus Bathyarchaeota archaeon]